MMITTYLLYLALSLVMTFWVGLTLNTNGRVFLIENFDGKEEIADAINDLLLIGFYLVNFGFIALALQYGDKPRSIVGAIEFLSTKIGLVAIVLGFMHFYLMKLFVKFRNSPIFRSIMPDTKEHLELEDKATVKP